MPRIEMRKLEDDYAEFVLENTDASMANALRRIMIAEVRGFRVYDRQIMRICSPDHRLELLIVRWRCDA
jgi:DNA-directed RNA polymerase alpha subunit